MTLKTFKLIILLLSASFTGFSQVKPLGHAHSHNDYENERPLLNAVDHGFTSVEADVHLKNGKLYVSHNSPKTFSDDILLENLYLKPLEKIVEQNGGMIYPGDANPLLLMIDFKNDGNATFDALEEVLMPYESMLCKAHESKNCAVKIFVSGNRPLDKILDKENKFITADGRPDDLGKGIDAYLMPVISDNYYKIIKSNNAQNAKEAILQIVTKAHSEGKKVRFWGAPDDEATWKFLLDLGVDLINTDKIEAFSLYLQNRNSSN